MYRNFIEVISLNLILWVILFAKMLLSMLLQGNDIQYWLIFSGFEWLWEILSRVKKLKCKPPNGALLIVPPVRRDKGF